MTLERLEINLFRGQSRDIGSPQVFGGQVLGQALVAATATVEKSRSALAARLFPAPRGLSIRRSSMKWTAPGTASTLPCGGWSPFSTASRFFKHVGIVFKYRRAGLEHQFLPCPMCRSPEALPDLDQFSGLESEPAGPAAC